MSDGQPAILNQLSALADPTRNRLLLLLERHELTVRELCATMQLPQSTVSRHLKALADSGWVNARAEGTSHLYAMPRPRSLADDSRDGNGGRGPRGLDETAARLWALVRDEVRSSPGAARDERRLEPVLATRRTRSQAFFASSAKRWDELRHELFGEAFHVAAATAFVDPDWTVGDLGCGTGQLSRALAPFVKHVIAVDSSAAMLRAAKTRLAGVRNVDLRRGDLEALPIDDARLNAATLALVLHHVPEPPRALGEATRVLAHGGRLVIVDMLPHERENYRQQMGHVWMGFSPQHICTWLTEAGLEPTRTVLLEPDPDAGGPSLFVATARKP